MTVKDSEGVGLMFVFLWEMTRVQKFSLEELHGQWVSKPVI